MDYPLLSCIEEAPPGFRFIPAPGQRHLRRRPFALFAASRESAEAILEPFGAAIAGIIVTVGAGQTWEQCGPLVYHMEVSHEQLPHLTTLLLPHLELLSRLQQEAGRQLQTSRELARAHEDRRRQKAEFALVRESLQAEIAERKRVAAELRATSETLHQIIDTIPHYVFWKSPGLTYLGCNKRFARAAGVETTRDIVGKTDYELSWRDTAELYRADDRRVIDLDTPLLNFIEPQSRSNGSSIWLETSKVPLHDDGGGVIGVLGMYQDVTERKEAEKRLQENEERLRIIFEASQAGIIMVDPLGTITFANGRMADMFGCGMEELIGSRYPDHLHPLDRQVGNAGMHRLIDGEIVHVATERRYLRSDGSQFWGFLSGRRLETPEGQLLALVGIIADITERKEAEEALSRALAFVKTLLDSSPMGIRVFDGETGACVQTNRTAADIAGGAVEALLRQNFRELGSWRDAGITATAEAVLADGQTRRIETDLYTSFGKQVIARYHFSRFSADGKPHLLVMGRDATEERRLEQENKRIAEQMLHVQKLESLGVLAGGIAHDFNNILTAVLGNADLALMRLPPASTARENILRIEQAARQAAELARQMLAYSGKGRFVIETLDINKVITEMTHMLDVSITKKAALRYNLVRDLPLIEADATQLRQVIMNLVINASEAIGEQSGVIAISTGVVECDRAYLSETWIDEGLSEGRYVYLEITDTGCGMDRETASKIFEPFFTTKFTGRGLGMAAVLGIVRGHKGAIKLYSEQGKGTNFKILLPATGRAFSRQASATSHQESWQATGTVLLVDDEEAIRTLGREMLLELGFDVLTAGNGREALEIFHPKKDEIVCVILDLTMPLMDGEETFRELRRIRPDARVVLSSGYNELEVTRKFVGTGLAGFIQKPYKLAALGQKLREVIET
ncbi:MAG TPA: PAS domain S-box protein [Desulfuromonadaceae bacterium]